MRWVGWRAGTLRLDRAAYELVLNSSNVLSQSITDLQVPKQHVENMLVDAECPYKDWSAKCLNWPIVTRVHVPRQTGNNLTGRRVY